MTDPATTDMAVAAPPDTRLVDDLMAFTHGLMDRIVALG